MTWWADAVGYEVYLRSFADSNGDGIGDLKGLLTRLGYLSWLGVDLIWITPFYPSPMRDYGYDVADYTDVDPSFGTLADLDAVVTRTHELGMRLIIDLVPNHSSSDHPWFQQARSSRSSPYRDYYIWRDPRSGDRPPNNWVSVFTDSAWTLDEGTGQFWLHSFLPEQPDLNWANPMVAREFDRIITFWLERGVDGFRIDVAHGLAKHPDLPDNPPGRAPVPVDADAAMKWWSLEHRYDRDQPQVLDVYRRWRQVAAPYKGLLLGEVYLFEANRLSRYVAEDCLDLVFWFPPLHIPWDADRIRQVLRDGASLAPGHLAWVTSSHDQPRAVSRFGGGALGQARALALSTLEFGLPGVAFLYQGEELGLADGVIGAEDTKDVAGRDGARTPMPWTPGPGLGFTSAERAWLPFGDHNPASTVEAQRADERSVLQRYRRLIHARHTLFRNQHPVAWLTDDGPVVAYQRGDVVVAANCAEARARLPLPGRWTLRFSSLGGGEGEIILDALELAGHEARIVTPIQEPIQEKEPG
jgi:alpha-glucosidase